MGFGSLQIDAGALLVMGEHVEVQMRLVEGQLGSKMVSGPLADQSLSVQELNNKLVVSPRLRHLIRRDSLEQLCEYVTGMGQFTHLCVRAC